MNETRYSVEIRGSIALLSHFERCLSARVPAFMRTEAPSPEVAESKIPELPEPLIGFANVRIDDAVMRDDRLMIFYSARTRYDARPLVLLARALPELTIAASAAREFEWGISFKATYAHGRQTTPWTLHQQHVQSGGEFPEVDLLSSERDVGAMVRYYHPLTGQTRDGQIVAILEDGGVKIAPVGALDAIDLNSLAVNGRPEDDPSLIR